MANKNERLPQNIAGPYYVDSTCVDCDMCRGAAPHIFKREDDIGYTVVHHQPATKEEYDFAEEARRGCPTESIGNDGSDATIRE